MYPFADLTPCAFDDLVGRARRERNRAIAGALAWLLRRVVAILAGTVDYPRAGQRGASS